MPVIEERKFRRLRDPFTDSEYWQIEVSIIIEDGQSHKITFQNERLTADGWAFWPKIDNEQAADFVNYSLATLSCNDSHPNAHIYDDPATHNPYSRVSIDRYAKDTTTIRRVLGGWCDTPAPPLPRHQTCIWSTPTMDDLEPDGDLFFYLHVELDNDSNHQLGFEFDGDRWEFAEHYEFGDVGVCQRQLDNLIDFTMATLTDTRDCDAPTVYGGNGRLYPPPEWVTEEFTQFCRRAYNSADWQLK